MKPFKFSNIVSMLNELVNNENDDNILTEIENILSRFVFNKTSSGYRYIVDLLLFCVKKDYKCIRTMKEIYNELSKNYNGISENKIEWNIVKSINAMNDMTDSEILSKNFKYNIRPTPKYFLNEILNIYYKNAI